MMLLSACTRVTIPTQPSNNLPDFPSTNSPTTKIAHIELRVTGNANQVRVRNSNPVDGLTQTITTLPYLTSFDITEDTFFLTLDVTPLSYPANIQFPFLNAQIFVDGKLFREATSGDWLLNTLSVNGTWRQ